MRILSTGVVSSEFNFSVNRKSGEFTFSKGFYDFIQEEQLERATIGEERGIYYLVFGTGYSINYKKGSNTCKLVSKPLASRFLTELGTSLLSTSFKFKCSVAHLNGVLRFEILALPGSYKILR